jgi:uncharacterized protein YjbI with pentapeptide repeats
MKIIKPDTLSLLYRNFQLSQDRFLSFGMMAMFHFDRATRMELLSEAQLWVDAMASIGEGVILDEGLPKPAGEFIAYGAAHAPNGTMVKEIEVALQVGELRKGLYVFGDRYFEALGITSPQPFQRMPVTPCNAFGGIGYPENRFGKGFAASDGPGGIKVRALPNIESPHDLLISRSDTPKPAGFWALHADAVQRTALLGAFDSRWLKERWPHLPDDTNAEYFHTAPRDQRALGYWRGDERIEITNMNGTRACIVTALPKLRARCFIAQRHNGQDAQPVFRELTARAETIWIFPEIESAIVLYRAVTGVNHPSAADVTHVMAEWESLSEAPRPIEHYREQFERQTSTKDAAVAAAAAVTAPSALTHEAAASVPATAAVIAAATATATAAAAAAGEAAPSLPDFGELNGMVAEVERMTAQLMREHGFTENDLEPYLKPAKPEAPMSMAELETKIADIDRTSKLQMQLHGLTDSDLERYLKPAAPTGTGDLAELKSMLQASDTQVAHVLQQSGFTKEQLLTYVSGKPELAPLANDLKTPPLDLDKIFAQMEAALLVASVGVLGKPEPLALPPLPEPEPEPDLKLAREQVAERHARGQTLAGYDMSGLDLSGLDLSGADFTGATLEKACLSHSVLRGAKFHEALLSGTDFSGADLNGAVLSDVNAGGALFVEAKLNEVDARGGDFTGANFDSANLQGAQLQKAVFDRTTMIGTVASACDASGAAFYEANLSEANFTKAKLNRATFHAALVDHADFTSAQCEAAEFYGTQARGVNFSGANLQYSRTDETGCFDGSHFVHANLTWACWEGARANDTVFDDATLDHGDFSRMSASRATFYRATAKESVFSGAELSHANLCAINLFKGSLREARLEGARLTAANLYAVDFIDASLANASVADSIIERTSLAVRGIVT